MNKKFRVKKGDTVFVNAGNDKGKTGKILEVIKDMMAEKGFELEIV